MKIIKIFTDYFGKFQTSEGEYLKTLFLHLIISNLYSVTILIPKDYN